MARLDKVRQVAEDALCSWRFWETSGGAIGPYPEWAEVILDLSNEVEEDDGSILDEFITGLIQDESMTPFWAGRLRAALEDR